MKKKSLLICIALGILSVIHSQAYTPLELSGLNVDIIVDSGEAVSASDVVDGAGWAYYSADKKSKGGVNQSFTSRSKVLYQLADFKENNALQFKQKLPVSATLTPTNEISGSLLWVLGIGTDGSGVVKITINYTDNSSSAPRETTFLDWWQENNSNTAVHGIGRIKIWGDSPGEFSDSYNFSLFEQAVRIDPTKTIASIKFEPVSNNQITILAATVGSGDIPEKTLHFFSNSHLDTQWNWTVRTVIEEYIPKTLRQNFALFEAYPDFQFNFEGAIKYQWIKEYYPKEYEKLKQYIAEERWSPSGASVDANDVMVPSAESLLRNFLYGQIFYKQEFGKKGGTDIMLPDCFGFTYALPTIGKHAGITGFHTAKLKWGSAIDYDILPNIAKWQGVDGSQIYAVLKPDAYDNEGAYRKDMSYDGGIYAQILANEENYGVPATFKYIGNTGDTGGSVEAVTAQWLQTSINSDGPVTVKLSTPTKAFEEFIQADATLPVINDELAMRTHGVGCYTSQTPLKYWNRKNELLADATEKTSVVSAWTGSLSYQSKPITDSWIRTLWHQFHDDLPGTSIPEAYLYTYNDHILSQLELSKTLINSVGAVAKDLSTEYAQGVPIVVYNALSIERTDIAEGKIATATEPVSISVYNSDGQAVPAQLTGFKDGESSFIFLATVPSLGYATYDVRLNSNDNPAVLGNLAITNNTIENDSYKITVNSQGDVSSILDKKQGKKELLNEPIRMIMLYDSIHTWPSWEIYYNDIIASPKEYVDENVNVSIAEQGPLRSTLKITRTRAGSEFVQYIRMTSTGHDDRIDFVNEVNWQSLKRLLKVTFPTAVSAPLATYDLSIGTIQRGNSTSKSYEFQGHQWADLTHQDNSYGISILNDCKYGWDKPDNNTLRLSLIHTPKGVLYDHGQYQDLGLNKFTYSFYRHLGSWNENTQWEAAKLNQPLMVFETSKHAGTLGASFAFASLNSEKVAVKALKKAEESDALIVRVYELTGQNQNNVEVAFATDILSAKEVNGLEEETGSVTVTGNKISFDINAYQPKSFAVTLKDPAITHSGPASTAVTLPYNIDVMSNDNNMNDGQMGASGYAYPAELIDDRIEADGIEFKIGDRADTKLNAIRCEGQQIDLPQNSNAKKIYLLAASTKKGGSTADFNIDEQKHALHVEYFTGDVGQWGTFYNNGFYRKENTAFTATHRHDVNTKKNIAYHFMYMFKYVIPVEGTPQTLTLPNDNEIIVFAATLSDNTNDDIIPLSEILNLPEFEDIDVETNEFCGSYLTPAKITVSGQTNNSESGMMAVDGNPFTKWCDNSSSGKWLEYEFDTPVDICQWNVIHAGRESMGMITRDFRLQYLNESGEWANADVVTGNTENKNIRFITPVKTTKVRLAIDKAEQNGNTARIFSFEVYGDDHSTPPAGIVTPKGMEAEIYNYPNPFTQETVISCTVPYNTPQVNLSVYDITGRVVDMVNYSIENGGQQAFVWKNKNLGTGIYFYTIATSQTRLNGKMIIE